MEYRLPTIEDQLILTTYVKEHHDLGENSISASLGLPVMEYDAWLKKILQNAEIGDADWGKSLLYLCFDGEKLVGLLSIRYELSKEMSDIYGDIGYGVRPSERRKGYATQMLRYALDWCRAYGMKTVILGCYKDNLASAATIQRCGGILQVENDNYSPGRKSQYYSITL